MKVTEAMKERAAAVCRERQLDITARDRDALLEAALADVPEPGRPSKRLALMPGFQAEPRYYGMPPLDVPVVDVPEPADRRRADRGDGAPARCLRRLPSQQRLAGSGPHAPRAEGEAVKVTDEMVERAMAVSVGGRVLIRNILEAALADEPEPADEDAIGKHVWPLQAILAEAHKWRLRNDEVEFPDLDDLEEILLRDTTGAPSPVKRIAELEAKLEEVRALVRTLPVSVKPHRDEFVRILDGKEQP